MGTNEHVSDSEREEPIKDSEELQDKTEDSGQTEAEMQTEERKILPEKLRRTAAKRKTAMRSISDWQLIFKISEEEWRKRNQISTLMPTRKSLWISSM